MTSRFIGTRDAANSSTCSSSDTGRWQGLRLFWFSSFQVRMSDLSSRHSHLASRISHHSHLSPNNQQLTTITQSPRLSALHCQLPTCSAPSASRQLSVVSCRKQMRCAFGSPLSSLRPPQSKSPVVRNKYASRPALIRRSALDCRLSAPNQQPTTITQFLRLPSLSTANCQLPTANLLRSLAPDT